MFPNSRAIDFAPKPHNHLPPVDPSPRRVVTYNVTQNKLTPPPPSPINRDDGQLSIPVVHLTVCCRTLHPFTPHPTTSPAWNPWWCGGGGSGGGIGRNVKILLLSLGLCDDNDRLCDPQTVCERVGELVQSWFSVWKLIL